MITTIVQEFSGKEFTKEDLLKIYNKPHPTTDDDVNSPAIMSKQKVIDEAVSPLEYAVHIQYVRSCISPVWKDIYKKKENCEKIKSIDIEIHKKHISTLEDELKREKKREKELKKFNALTNEKRDRIQEVRNKKEKEMILRRYDLK